MKYKHIAMELTALSLIAFAFVAAAAAVGTVHYPTAYVEVKGRNCTFTIMTTTDTSNGAFSGNDVDPDSIVITITDTKGNTVTVYPDSSSITRTSTTIVIQIFKPDFPSRASAYNIVGNIVGGTYTGDTFYASGPGWQFGNVH